jgi:hypothetical protein
MFFAAISLDFSAACSTLIAFGSFPHWECVTVICIMSMTSLRSVRCLRYPTGTTNTHFCTCPVSLTVLSSFDVFVTQSEFALLISVVVIKHVVYIRVRIFDASIMRAVLRFLTIRLYHFV